METKKNGRIFNRYFVLLFITSVCFCFASEMLNVVLPLYVTEDLGKTAAVSGLMTTFYTVASAVSRPVNGLLTDKLSRRLVMAVGCALYAAGYTLKSKALRCGDSLLVHRVARDEHTLSVGMESLHCSNGASIKRRENICRPSGF